MVRKVFDICFEKQDCESAFLELADVLQEEVSLLHRAVQKRCRQMAELLLAYVPPFLAGANDTEIMSFQGKLEFKAKWGNIFKPDMAGPAGLTPLHVAASLQDAEEVVDALTSDPCQVHSNFRETKDTFPFEDMVASTSFTYHGSILAVRT